MSDKISRPTDGEMEILRVLWTRGPSTVRQVHKVLHVRKKTSYNTTQKLMQIMVDKGCLVRDESDRPAVYSAAAPEEQTQRRLMSEFLQRVFGGSARKMVAAMTASDIPADELAQIRRLLDEHKGHKP